MKAEGREVERGDDGVKEDLVEVFKDEDREIWGEGEGMRDDRTSAAATHLVNSGARTLLDPRASRHR